MNAARKPGRFALFLLAVACLFTPLPSPAVGQMHRHNDSDFQYALDEQKRINEHLHSEDLHIEDIYARLNKIEGIGECLCFLIGAGLLERAGTILIRKRDSA